MKEKLHEKGPPITVELTETFALLVKTKWSAGAEVTFTFDMHNRTTESSPDIYGIYFYTGNGWAFNQDNQECPQSSGNSAGLTFKKRHFIKTPIPRLPKGGWAQVRLIGKKTIATAYRGEELKDSYTLAGRTLFRVSTATGDYDTPINIKIEADEIPF